jgi:hypothetical protein
MSGSCEEDKDFRRVYVITSARVRLQILVNSAACILLRRGQNVAESLAPSTQFGVRLSRAGWGKILMCV